MYSLPSLSTALSCLRLIQLKLVFQVQIKGCTKKTLFFKKRKKKLDVVQLCETQKVRLLHVMVGLMSLCG